MMVDFAEPYPIRNMDESDIAALTEGCVALCRAWGVDADGQWSKLFRVMCIMIGVERDAYEKRHANLRLV
jgi:hypothetical protein